ncbi:MAG: ATP-binding protein [Thermodesulfobacteriota bacterium]
MIRRYLQEPILESLKHFPAVLLTGARQVGKSTLAQALIETSWNARYFTLDDRITLDAALKDPDGFIEGLPTPVVIDEVQRAPDLLRAIKRRIDIQRNLGQYLLTGSANIMTLSTVSESLAGRIVLHTLHPFCWPELLGKPIPLILNDLFKGIDSKKLLKSLNNRSIKHYKPQLIKRILNGGYPVPALMESDHARRQWFSSYRQTYLERDILNIRVIENLPDFNRLLSLVALRTGRLLNLSDLSRETGLPFTTLRRYMNLLEVTYQIFFIRPYFSHLGKRLIKTPKLYFNDTGMASHLIGVNSWDDLESQGNAGPMVETWVASELLKIVSVLNHQFRIYFWRTHAGQEVDFLIEQGRRLVAIEVKWGHRIDESDMRNLDRLAEDLKERLLFSIILYSGEETLPLNPKTVAMPFSIFFLG